MKEEKIKLKPVNKLQQNDDIKLENLDFTEGYVCDFETGICGPEAEVQEKKTEIEEVKK